MEDNSLPLRVERFVREYIPSICHLDALVRLARMQGEAIGSNDLAVIMAQKPEVIATVLEELRGSGLVGRGAGGFSFEPDSDYLRQNTIDLVEAYDRFPVQLIRIVYEPRVKPTNNAAQSFADAFRLRKDQ
jgi:hypothetical protein